MIPERGGEKQDEPYDCSILLPRESSQAAEQGRRIQEETSSLLVEESKLEVQGDQGVAYNL